MKYVIHAQTQTRALGKLQPYCKSAFSNTDPRRTRHVRPRENGGGEKENERPVTADNETYNQCEPDFRRIRCSEWRGNWHNAFINDSNYPPRFVEIGGEGTFIIITANFLNRLHLFSHLHLRYFPFFLLFFFTIFMAKNYSRLIGLNYFNFFFLLFFYFGCICRQMTSCFSLASFFFTFQLPSEMRDKCDIDKRIKFNAPVDTFLSFCFFFFVTIVFKNER